MDAIKHSTLEVSTQVHSSTQNLTEKRQAERPSNNSESMNSLQAPKIVCVGSSQLVTKNVATHTHDYHGSANSSLVIDESHQENNQGESLNAKSSTKPEYNDQDVIIRSTVSVLPGKNTIRV